MPQNQPPADGAPEPTRPMPETSTAPGSPDEAPRYAPPQPRYAPPVPPLPPQRYQQAPGAAPDPAAPEAPYAPRDPYGRPAAYGGAEAYAAPAPPGSEPYVQAAYPQQGGDPYAQGAPPIYAPGPPTNVLAIISMICSIVGFFSFAIFAVAGVILGHIGLNQIKRTGEGGRGMAVAGLIVGYLAIAFWGLLLLIWIFAIGLAVWGSGL